MAKGYIKYGEPDKYQFDIDDLPEILEKKKMKEKRNRKIKWFMILIWGTGINLELFFEPQEYLKYITLVVLLALFIWEGYEIWFKSKKGFLIEGGAGSGKMHHVDLSKPHKSHRINPEKEEAQKFFNKLTDDKFNDSQ